MNRLIRCHGLNQHCSSKTLRTLMKLLTSAKWFRRILWGALGVVLGAILYGLLQLNDPVAIAPVARTAQFPQFLGQRLLVASDADMVATAYADGGLQRISGVEDALTVIDLPLTDNDYTLNQVQVSNSVMSWPQIIATSPDGAKAYVVEVRSRPPDGVEDYDSIEDMPPGSLLTVVDLSQAQPAVIETMSIGNNPEHIAISPDGRLLAIDIDEVGRELVFVALDANGNPGDQYPFAIANAAGQPAQVNSISWHPSGRFLALNLDNRSVAFYEVSFDPPSGGITLMPYGNSVEVGNWLSAGKFTSDGRFYLVPDMKWRTWNNIRQLNYLMNPKGEMVSIRFGAPAHAVRQPEIVSRAEVGLGPEGFALSPDDSLVVTVNMRRTYLPDRLPAWRGKSHSSLSLLTLDLASGQLVTLDEYGFEGLLPEDAVFDVSGRSLAVVIYNYREPDPHKGAIEFWNVIRGAEPELERTGFRIEVTRGPHATALVSRSD